MAAQGDGESIGPGGKKKRVSIFQPAERMCLVDLIQKYFHIVECKRTDACSSKAKTRQWSIIAAEFNARAIYTVREAQTLKTAWENMKKKAKGIITKENQNRLATGGGPPPEHDNGDPAMNRIVTLLRPVVQGFNNGLDSDSAGGGVPIVTTEFVNDEKADGVEEVTLDVNDDPSNMLVHNLEGNPPVEVELSGDWSSFTAPMLRTPRTSVLRTFSSTPAPLSNQEDCNTFIAPQPSSSSTPRVIPKVASGTRHLCSSSRRRPFVKQAEAEQLAQVKIKTLTGSAEQASEEHEVTMRILFLQEQQEEEKLKQQQLKTLQEEVKLQQEKLKLEVLQQDQKNRFQS